MKPATMQPTGAFALALAVAACAPSAPPPPRDLRQVAVAPPVNRTGRELVVAGAWWLERALGQPRTTVPDVLAAEARAVLARSGFQVVQPGAGAPELRFRLERWNLDPAAIDFIAVAVRAELVAVDGRILWSATRRRWMVPVRGAPSAAVASEWAARTIAETFLAGWRPAS